MTNLQSESVAKLIPALLAAQSEFQPAVKNAVNPAFKSKYVTLDAALDAVSGALVKHGVWLAQQTDVTETGAMILTTKLIHSSGEWIGCLYPISPVKSDPQGVGSALTFARRYSLMALVGIAPEDDDGNAATNGTPERAGPGSRPADRGPARCCSDPGPDR
jgi:hypothetical protein